jgi:hypothetical protein
MGDYVQQLQVIAAAAWHARQHSQHCCMTMNSQQTRTAAPAVLYTIDDCKARFDCSIAQSPHKPKTPLIRPHNTAIWDRDTCHCRCTLETDFFSLHPQQHVHLSGGSSKGPTSDTALLCAVLIQQAHPPKALGDPSMMFLPLPDYCDPQRLRRMSCCSHLPAKDSHSAALCVAAAAGTGEAIPHTGACSPSICPSSNVTRPLAVSTWFSFPLILNI